MGWWSTEEDGGVIFSFKRKISLQKGESFTITVKTCIDRRNPYFEDPFLEDIKVSGEEDNEISWDSMPDRMYSGLCLELERYFRRRV